jgi:hypothetical protein
MSIEKQPLRIETGWKVTWNTFDEVDPTADTMHHFSGSSLLVLYHEHANRLIDLSWRPEESIDGNFILLVLNTDETFNPKTNTQDVDADWEQPYLRFESRERLEVVAKLEQLMLQIPPCQDPRILKNRGVIDEPSETYRLQLVEDGLSDQIIAKIIISGNSKIQNLLIEDPQITKDILQKLAKKGCTHKVTNRAKTKLNSKKYRN